jgi:hypothetical protein
MENALGDRDEDEPSVENYNLMQEFRITIDSFDVSSDESCIVVAPRDTFPIIFDMALVKNQSQSPGQTH